MLNKNTEIKEKTQDESLCCGEGCSCNTVSSKRKTIKVVVSLIVLLGIGGVFFYKFSTRQDKKPVESNAASFNLVRTEQNKPKESAVKENKHLSENSFTLTSERNSGKIGDYIESLGELNKVASSKDAVFVFIPAPKNELVDVQTKSAVLAAQQTLKSNGVTLGLYTLQPISQDYVNISKQIQSPAILVAVRGRGMAAVTGDVNETKLLQAFTSSSRAGGCGSSSGCGPSGMGCN